ncbi:unnamed protein product [Urochloa humidicola]
MYAPMADMRRRLGSTEEKAGSSAEAVVPFLPRRRQDDGRRAAAWPGGTHRGGADLGAAEWPFADPLQRRPSPSFLAGGEILHLPPWRRMPLLPPWMRRSALVWWTRRGRPW